MSRRHRSRACIEREIADIREAQGDARRFADKMIRDIQRESARCSPRMRPAYLSLLDHVREAVHDTIEAQIEVLEREADEIGWPLGAEDRAELNRDYYAGAL